MNDHQYQWLVAEASTVKYPKVFQFKQRAISPPFGGVVQKSELPEDYVHFIDLFGETLLFRDSTNGTYSLCIMNRPDFLIRESGDTWMFFGTYNLTGIFFIRKANAKAYEPDVYILQGGAGARRLAGTFGEWIKAYYQKAKKSFGKRSWERALTEPLPLSEEASRYLADYRKVRIEDCGPADERGRKLLLHNHSGRELEALEVRIVFDDCSDCGRAIFVPQFIGKSTREVIVQPKEWQKGNIVRVELQVPGPEDRGLSYLLDKCLRNVGIEP